MRGGSCRDAIVLTGVMMVDDRRFLPLFKSSNDLSKFLTGTAASSRPLACTTVFETLQQLRNAKTDDMAFGRSSGTLAASEAVGGQALCLAAPPEDPCEALGFDAPLVAGPDKTAPRCRKRAKACRSQLPSIITVDFELSDGTMWNPAVMVDKANRSAAIEITTDNLTTLSKVIGMQRASCSSVVGVGRRKTRASRAPRSCTLGREYFQDKRNRWVKKMPAVKVTEDGEGGDKPWARRRFRTVTRQPTDDGTVAGGASSSTGGKPRGRRRANRKAAGVGTLPGVVDDEPDCLADDS